MGSRPSVSIVLGFLDATEFFEEAIDSVFAQTHTDWELLLVDDGSTDGSDVIAQWYAMKHPERIRYLHHPGRINRGTSATRNLGISHARGRYIAALDADDVYLPNFLERHVELLEAHPEVATAFGPCERWYSWTGKPEDAERDFVARPHDAYDLVVEPPALFLAMLEKLYAVPHGFVVRHSAMQGIAGYEETFPGMYEDQVLMSKLFLRYPTYVSSECHFLYRKHRKSMVMMTDPAAERSARLKFLNWLDSYVERHPAQDPRVRKSVQHQLWKSHHPGLARERQRIEDLGARIRNRLVRTWKRSPFVAS